MRSGLLVAEAEAKSDANACAAPGTVEALDDALIAGLTPGAIAHMTDDELVGAIRAAHLPLRGGIDGHLEFRDRRTLERLVYLARRCCQSRTSAVIVQQTFVYGGE